MLAAKLDKDAMVALLLPRAGGLVNENNCNALMIAALNKSVASF